jgi:hypothetical protein
VEDKTSSSETVKDITNRVEEENKTTIWGLNKVKRNCMGSSPNRAEQWKSKLTDL